MKHDKELKEIEKRILKNQIDNRVKNAKQTLKNVLNDPKKALKWGIINADRHAESKAFEGLEDIAIGSTQGMIYAANTMLGSIDQPLSVKIINNIRTALCKDKI